MRVALWTLLLLALLIAPLSGCELSCRAEGDGIEDAVEDLGDSIEDAVDELDD